METINDLLAAANAELAKACISDAIDYDAREFWTGEIASLTRQAASARRQSAAKGAETFAAKWFDAGRSDGAACTPRDESSIPRRGYVHYMSGYSAGAR